MALIPTKGGWFPQEPAIEPMVQIRVHITHVPLALALGGCGRPPNDSLFINRLTSLTDWVGVPINEGVGKTHV